jgi:hypothetical protein
MAKLFSVYKPKPFHIEPRYWDPVKEKREERERRIKAEMGIKDEGGTYRPYIARGEFRRGISNGKWSSAKAQRHKSNIRVLIYVVLLALAIYFMLK